MKRVAGAIVVALALIAPLAVAQTGGAPAGYVLLASESDAPAPLARLVDVDAANQPLAAVLASITRQARVGFTYDRALPGLAKPVTLHMRAIGAGSAIVRTLEESGLDALVSAAGHVVLVRHAEAKKPAVGVITGIVTDTSLKAIAAAEVLLVGTDITLTVGNTGRFEFRDVPPRLYMLNVRRFGFSPLLTRVQVTAGDTLRLSFALAPVANELNKVVVTSDGASWRETEFEEDRKIGTGDFISGEEIHKRNTVAEVLRFSKLVDIKPIGPSTYGAFGRRDGCPMQILLDGVPVSGSDTRATLGTLPTTGFLAGIEIYAGPATTPFKFASSLSARRCGTIVVWTK